MSRHARHGGRGAYDYDPAEDEDEEYELAGYSQGPARVPESTWERAKAWHLQAPAERLPITGALLTWPASWLAYTTMVPGRYVGFAAIFASACTAATWAKHNRELTAAIEADRKVLPPQRLTWGEAWLVSVAIGGWITAAVTWGPLAGPFHLLSAAYVAGVIIGYWWLRRHPAIRAARDRRDDDATWIAEKSEWHRIAPVAGLADFDLQAAEPTHLGKQLLLTGSPNGTLASRIAGRPKTYEEKLCHILDLPYGSVGISGTAYPGELLVDIRHKDPAVAMGSLLHPAICPDSPYAAWFPARPSVRNPIVYGVTPETGEPMKLALWNQYGGRTIYLVAKTRWGKALALETPLPTPTGWTTMGEVRPGDWLLGADGRPVRVTFATEVMHDHDCYEVEFDDGSVIVADADHMWLTEDRRSVTSANNVKHGATTRTRVRHVFPQVRTTTEIAATLRAGRDQRLNHEVANCRPLDLPEAPLPVPPYTLGIWLGDGHSGAAQISTADPEVLARIETDGLTVAKMPGHVYDYGVRLPGPPPVPKRGRRGPCRRCGRPCTGSGTCLCRPCWLATYTFGGALRALGVFRNKHIPAPYLRASEQQRRDLLAGLLDSDGYCKPGGHVEFTSTSYRLAVGVRELAATLGYTSRLRSKRVKGRTEATSTCWTVSFTPPDKVFYLPRKTERQQAGKGRTALRRFITDVRPVASVPVRCVQVASADHLYLAGESYIPTHNTMVLNCIRERVTLMDDAVLVQINGAKVGDEKAWEPLSAITAAGAAQMGDPSHAERIMATLEWLQLLITARSETHIQTGDSVFQPTAEDPAYIIIIDEIDEVAKIPGASAILQFLASKQASEAVSLIEAGQRYTQAWVGGAGVQMNVAEVLVGLLNKSSEARHITGAEYELPDIAEYAKGEKGFWQVWDTDLKKVTGRGRAFDIGSIGDQQVIIAERVEQGRAPSLPPGFEFMPDSSPEQVAADGGHRPSPTGGEAGGGSLRDRFASVFDMDSRRPARHARPEPSRPAAPLAPAVQIRGVPPVLVPVMLAELAQGTSARKLSDAFRSKGLAVGKTKAHEYLTAAVTADIAVLEGEGRGSEYRLPPDDAGPADPPAEPEGEGPDGGYTTIEALAEAVAAGDVDVDDKTRAVLMRARDLASREGPRRHLAGLPPTGTGDES